MVDIMEKAKASLSGMHMAEGEIDPETPLSTMVREVIGELILANGEEDFSTRMTPLPTNSPLAAVPLGLKFWNQIYLGINWGKTDGLMVHPRDKCAAVAAAILTSNAIFGTPTGVWANEVAVTLSGIDNDFVRLLGSAVNYAGEGSPPRETMENLRKRGGMAAGVVASSLYCCVAFGGDYAKATDAARQEGNPISGETTALTGALTGAMNPNLFKEDDSWTDVAASLVG
jgi:hypothetical protein